MLGKKKAREKFSVGGDVLVAKSGDYFRTLVYPVGKLADSAVYFEAFEDAQSCLWRVNNITYGPSLAHDGDVSIVVQPHTDGLAQRDLFSLEEALKILLEYEQANVLTGVDAKEVISDEALGNEHVLQFALNEGFVPDKKMELKKHQKGRIVEGGEFYQAVLDKLQQTAIKPEVKRVYSEQKSGITGLFAHCASVESDDVYRLLDVLQGKDVLERFKDKVSEVVLVFLRLQENDLAYLKEVSGTLKKGDGIEAIQERLDESLQELAAHEFVSLMDETERQRLQDFVNLMQFSFGVAYARKLFQDSIRSPEDEKLKQKFKTQKEAIEAYYRELGADEVGVKQMNASLVAEPAGRQTVYLRSGHDGKENYNETLAKCISSVGYADNYDCYFVPDDVSAYWEHCAQLLKDYEAQVDEMRKQVTQKKRIEVDNAGMRITDLEIPRQKTVQQREEYLLGDIGAKFDK